VDLQIGAPALDAINWEGYAETIQLESIENTLEAFLKRFSFGNTEISFNWNRSMMLVTLPLVQFAF
jgi:hypothetical protein